MQNPQNITQQDGHFTTLAGSYDTSEMVTMRNLRLPELDKNHNIDQLKALVFESKNCKNDVILGADFLTQEVMENIFRDVTDAEDGNITWHYFTPF